MTKIAAVVLNYGTPEDAILAVRSLLAGDIPVTPIVVNNASGDDSVSRLRHALRDVDIVDLRENAGFSGGCNAGVRHALAGGATHVLLLNSDTIVPPDAVAALSRVLTRESSLGIVGPVVRFRSDPGVVESAGISYGEETCRMRLAGFGAAATAIEPFVHRRVDAVSGCAMLVRRDVFETVGLFAEDYFFGFEDVDFCLRARARGFLTGCVGSTFVLHEGHRTVGRRSDRRIYFAMRNHLLLASRFPSEASRLRRGVRLARVAALNVAHAVTGGDVSIVPALGACVRGGIDYCAGRFGNR